MRLSDKDEFEMCNSVVKKEKKKFLKHKFANRILKEKIKEIMKSEMGVQDKGNPLNIGEYKRKMEAF